jgi:hypothetical protein
MTDIDELEAEYARAKKAASDADVILADVTRRYEDFVGEGHNWRTQYRGYVCANCGTYLGSHSSKRSCARKVAT